MCVFNNSVNQKLSTLQKKYNDLLAKYNTDTAYYDNQIKSLNNLILKSISMPDLSYLSGKGTLLNPRDYKDVSTYAQADSQYYSFEYNDWLDIILKVQTTFKATWTTDVFDCDDFALLFSAMSTYAIYKSGFNHSLALGIAWSNTHAFNIFLDNSGTLWILEPQTGEVISKANEGTGDYKIIEEWFMN